MTAPAPTLPGQPPLQPLFLKLEGRSVLVVGGGVVAERKVVSLLGSGAVVRLVAPDATDGLKALAGRRRLVWRRRRFAEADFDGVWLAVAATSDARTQRRVAAAGEARRTFVLAVDDPRHASAYGGATVHRPPFLIAISSSGAAPALSRLVREIVEGALPGEDWVARAKELRARWKANGTPVEERFAALVREFKNV